jgi:FKBP-type peptidyl-prolyl cis-trans isomerase 2
MEAVMSKKHLFAVLAAALLTAGCKSKTAAPAPANAPDLGQAAKQGPKATFNYTLSIDGKKVETSLGKEPLNVTLGAGQVVPGVEEALASMKAGDKRTITIPPEKGYGPYHQDGVRKVPRAAFKNMAGLKPGMTVDGQANGHSFSALVKAVTADEVTLDLNHPLAGKTLTFDLELVSITGS